MKAKYISTLVIISIMVVCLVGIVSFTKGSNTNDEFEMLEEVNNNITQIRSQVMMIILQVQLQWMERSVLEYMENLINI